MANLFDALQAISSQVTQLVFVHKFTLTNEKKELQVVSYYRLKNQPSLSPQAGKVVCFVCLFGYYFNDA